MDEKIKNAAVGSCGTPEYGNGEEGEERKYGSQILHHLDINRQHLTPQQLGGLTVKALYGREYFRELGRKGFQATVNKYFGGNRKAATQWLSAKGLYEQDKNVSYGSVFQDPGPHPAHL
ncbi:MAG: hypothetical protein KDJ65_01500 [Anaerolineae bacterium]|nr:hypothetical protein [Anaerolineae bacterium]